MKLKMTIVEAPGAEPVTVRTNLLCIAEWEREMKRKVGDGLGIGIMDMAYWAHFLLKMAGKTKAATYKEWLEAYPDLEISQVEDVTDPNPTDAATTDDN